jgi:hypothetical protein
MSYNNGPKIVSDGLVLCLDAGNNKSYPSSGTSWSDLSGNNNNGTLTNGPTFTGSFGGGIVFDGVNDYVNIPYSSSLSPATQFTLGAFVNITGWGSNFASIIYKQNNFTSFYEQYSLTVTSGSFGFSITGTDRVQRGTGGSYTFGETAYLCVTANSTTGVAEAYKNGVKVNTTTGITAFDISTNPVTIGAATPVSYPAYAMGRIHIAQIYNRSLSASEILQNYNATKGRFAL